MKNKVVARIVKGVRILEGDGAPVFRSIGTQLLDNYDPFLMLDEFFVQPPAGFPDHPHRGFETVTYMLSGSFEHRDFCGNHGVINTGDIQWMTAGKGIVHSEMPATPAVNHGLQLWINLEKQFKMINPSYQDVQSSDIPTVDRNGLLYRVLSGKLFGVESSVKTLTPVLYLHITGKSKTSQIIEIPEDWNTFSYILSGSVEFISNDLVQTKPHQNIVFGKGGQIEFRCPEESSFIIVSGQPLNQPIVKQGPFVMNTSQEIQQANWDYRNGKNGFENALKWTSLS